MCYPLAKIFGGLRMSIAHLLMFVASLRWPRTCSFNWKMWMTISTFYRCLWIWQLPVGGNAHHKFSNIICILNLWSMFVCEYGNMWTCLEQRRASFFAGYCYLFAIWWEALLVNMEIIWAKLVSTEFVFWINCVNLIVIVTKLTCNLKQTNYYTPQPLVSTPQNVWPQYRVSVLDIRYTVTYMLISSIFVSIFKR